ncbi:MAG: excisionase family DNA-binding protein [Propionibacteriaceae bacterium]|jgi:excisionase family DNA binding protein|nr:excisionase family DNA-binding protein [Propionibacteriaceae bacterium]
MPEYGINPSKSTYLTIPAAAEDVGISQDTIRRLIADGTLPAKRVRRLWFIPRAELDRVFSPEPTVKPAKSKKSKR